MFVFVHICPNFGIELKKNSKMCQLKCVPYINKVKATACTFISKDLKVL